MAENVRRLGRANKPKTNKKTYAMISNLAYVHPDARLGKDVVVEPFAYIAGDVVIATLLDRPNAWYWMEHAWARDARYTPVQ